MCFSRFHAFPRCCVTWITWVTADLFLTHSALSVGYYDKGGSTPAEGDHHVAGNVAMEAVQVRTDPAAKP